MPMSPRFYFAACQAGAEKAVKAEVLAQHPALRFAFSRPGFVTFKEEDPADGNDLPPGEPLRLSLSIFTRLWGEVLAQTRDPATLGSLLGLIPPGVPLHAFDRDRFVPGDEEEGYAFDMKIRSIPEVSALLAGREACGPGQESPGFGPRTSPEALVYDLIWVDDFHVFLGRHLSSPDILPFPGNLCGLPLPPHAPSRAWLKLEEAILRFRPVVQPGWQALEIGCAPGGATTALLDRGFRVVGIDPQYMAETVAGNPNFRHIRKPARYTTREDLTGVNPDWIVMDMSIPPKDALGELSHVIGLLRDLHGKKLALRRGFLTLKLNDWKYASEVSFHIKRLSQLGFEALKPIQLASNRQEFFVYSGKFRI